LPNELDREMHANQTHCTCGKNLDRVKYECPLCGEWHCSDECRQSHIETLEARFGGTGELTG